MQIIVAALKAIVCCIHIRTIIFLSYITHYNLCQILWAKGFVFNKGKTQNDKKKRWRLNLTPGGHTLNYNHSNLTHTHIHTHTNTNTDAHTYVSIDAVYAAHGCSVEQLYCFYTDQPSGLEIH